MFLTYERLYYTYDSRHELNDHINFEEIAPDPEIERLEGQDADFIDVNR